MSNKLVLNNAVASGQSEALFKMIASGQSEALSKMIASGQSEALSKNGLLVGNLERNPK